MSAANWVGWTVAHWAAQLAGRLVGMLVAYWAESKVATKAAMKGGHLVEYLVAL